MRLKDFLKAEKQNIQIGDWKSGNVPRAQFPLSKQRGGYYRQGPSVVWRVVKFDARGRSFRVLVTLNEAKERYEAKLGMEMGSDLALLCVYEFHGTEPGWHCHLTCDLADNIPTGVHRGPWITRLPDAWSSHRRKIFGISQSNALTVAVEFFRIHERRSLL